MKKPLIALFTLLTLPQAWALSIEPADWGDFRYDENVVCSTSAENSDIFGVVKKHGKYGMADSTGKVLLPLEYDDGACLNGYVTLSKQGKWGLVDAHQRVVAPFVFGKQPWDFNGVDKVIITDERDDGIYSAVYGVDGRVLLDYQRGRLRFENDVLIRFEDDENGQSGFMDTQGNIILAGQYGWVKLLDDKAGDERFMVSIDNQTMMIDRNKNILTQGYDDMEPFDEQGISRVHLDVNGKRKIGFVDRNGILIVKLSSHRYPMWNDVYGHEWQLRTDGGQCTLFLQDRAGQAVNDLEFPDESCRLLATPNQTPSQEPTAKRGLWDRIWAWVVSLIR
ncbi:MULTISPECIES: WG repeat-containing protein [Moraxella]|uniref:KWG Leptospira n=1 Tax=Moraxella lacunata TaxID=477 RepID=A0A1B8Q781_MORLA|nr:MULTISPECIES: WG repeat-containing protein [Moraxella]MBE9578956.1 WG repeat-containing protein [Moraxella sp. K1664]MBE9588301.1 WG repeat-containing protein [Moraxella sp. K1630]MBE9591237.1 WG repeat-containing protein [Moraxella sp. K127]MBE9596488.1 WG repeat-containing protein [Moraxella sp. K2450]MDH9218876.1 WG repeat-containing protein [Moraxella lacunata]